MGGLDLTWLQFSIRVYLLAKVASIGLISRKRDGLIFLRLNGQIIQFNAGLVSLFSISCIFLLIHHLFLMPKATNIAKTANQNVWIQRYPTTAGTGRIECFHIPSFSGRMDNFRPDDHYFLDENSSSVLVH